MFKLFHKKLNKKGFTLAELLIVVAIIAILVAIAIPIFMNSLAKAEKAAEEANIRSVKAAAINTILEKWDDKDNPMGYTDADKKVVAKLWDVDAEVENGDITKCDVQPVKDDKHTSGPEVTKEDKDDHYKYSIKLTIKDTQVTAKKAATT